MSRSSRFRGGCLALGWVSLMMVPGTAEAICEVPYAVSSSRCEGGDVLDDGTPEHHLGHASTGPRQTLVQKFTPASYPAVYHQICVAWSRSGVDSDLSYEVVIYDDDGFQGEPGTLLAGVPVLMRDVPLLAEGDRFSSIPIAPPAVQDGSIYLGFRWDPSVELDFYFPVDASPTTPQQVIRESSDDGGSWIYTLSLGRALFIRARSTAEYAVVPSAQELSHGNILDEEIPFGVASSRYQQVYQNAEVGSGWITEIRFRGAWGEFGAPICPDDFQDATIKLSTTQKAVDGLSTTFSANVGADETVVFHGDLWLASRGNGIGGLDPFDVAIPLQRPFQFTGGGNLLLDVNLPNGSIPLRSFDAHDAADSVSRAYCADFPGCNTLDAAFTPDSRGLVTMLLFGEGPLFSDGFESGDTSRWSSVLP